MTIKMPRNLMTAVSVVAFAVMLHGCGGGGGSSPVATMGGDTPPTTPPTTIMGQIIPSGTTLTLPPGHGLQEGTLRAKMGQTITLRDDDGNVIVSGTCTDVDCSADLTGDEVTLVGNVELLEANALVLALLTDLLPPDPADLNELETAQAAAAGAADAAMTAAGNANTTATEAETARATAATLQTGETSEGLAEKAREQAGMAHTAYMDAKAASEAAAEADNVSDAIRAQVDAENARDAAQDAETSAGNYAQMAADAADVELMIDVTVKSVGDTTIDAEASRSVVTAGEGAKAQVTDTGLQAKGDQPMTTGVATAGKEAVDKSAPGVTPVVAYVAPVVSAAQRPFPIGKLVDSADDTARLMIVTHYAGTNTVKVFASDASNVDDANNPSSSKPNTIQTAGIDTVDTPGTPTDDVFVDLKSVGMYYRAGTTASITAGPAGDSVAATATPQQVYSYIAAAGADPTYVILKSTNTPGAGGAATYTYSVVEIHVMVDVDGVPVDGSPVDEVVEVTAKIPEATAYKHIHFGVWAALGEAAKDGTQKLSDLGTGFVQNWSGNGLTSIGGGLNDMPNNGTAIYNGNWVAAVQAKDDDGNGPISLANGVASLDANFELGEVDAMLTGLAKLDGTIDSNTFSGTKAAVASTNAHTLDSAGKFTGTFSGGFYGAKAAEAGGVFDFASDDDKDGANEGGAFRGAFGADRKPPTPAAQ